MKGKKEGVWNLKNVALWKKLLNKIQNGMKQEGTNKQK